MRTFQAHITRAGLVAVTAVGMFLCWQYWGCQWGSKAPKRSRVAECRVSFRIVEHGAFADVCFDDKSLVEDLILQPMRNAKRDPKPADYAVLGTLTFVSPDGSQETLLLFTPWGRYKRGDAYFVTDFSGLQAECEETLRNAHYRVKQSKDE